ncbi:hypothetical protein Hypma_002003 [Hypsizygus marmoreus]|uniref:F-box domain-containing protein n=1 Tax=Hypsizygus marmoreus TaxID=39966 RepID=A0A369J9B1_HYPMA|nr:hypothetical protein Hypma_002003 [Hypsizygus marmoreus]
MSDTLEPLPPRVPQELIDKIIDDLHDEFKTLKICSLTSRSLLSQSQSHLFSSVHIKNQYFCARFRSLVDVNPRLLEYARELTLQDFFQAQWMGSDSDLSFILTTATSVRSFHICGGFGVSWTNIPQNVQNALFAAFCSPSLNVAVPPVIFGLNMNLKHLILTGLMLDQESRGDLNNEISIDFSRVRTHTLEIWVHQRESFLPVIAQSNSFVSHLRKLVLYYYGDTASLTVPIMKSAFRSLEMMVLRVVPDEYSPNLGFKHDFSLMPKLQHLAFHFMVTFGEPATFTIAIREVIDFFILNPSAFGLKRFDIQFIPNWSPYYVPATTWNQVLNIIGQISHWNTLDELLSTSGHNVCIVLGIIEGNYSRLRYSGLPYLHDWRGEIREKSHAWHDVIHAQMPLASQCGALTTDVILVED